MKKAKDPAFSKLHGIPVFACYIFFSLSRIVCFLLANVILFVNIDPSRWGTLTSHWGGWESKKQSKYQYKIQPTVRSIENSPLAFSPDGNDVSQ